MESYKGVRTMSQGVFCVLAMSALMICLGCDQPATEGELPTSTSRASGTPIRSMIVPAASNATLQPSSEPTVLAAPTVSTVDETTIVARVNGLPITAGRLIETRTRTSENLVWMRDILSRIVPDEQGTGTLEDALSDPNSLIPESSGLREIFGPRVALVDSQDIETAALAHLVIRLAIYSEAIKAGYSTDPAEVGSLVEKNKTDFLYGLRPEMEKHVSTYGFDVFFDEVLTAVITEEITIQSWSQQLIANRKSYEEGENIIKRTKRAMVDAAQVVIVDAAAVGTTVEKAVAFARLDIALDPAPPEPICANGTAVSNPIDNRGLVDDCEALLEGKDTLRGTATLDWSAGSAVTGWEGVTAGGTPTRLTKLQLPNKSLTGTIPPEIGLSSELTHLDLSSNSLTGDIPEELGQLRKLESLKLSGNSLTGCLPLHWRDIATHDLNSLNLLYCAPTPPDSFSIGTPGGTRTCSTRHRHAREFPPLSVGNEIPTSIQVVVPLLHHGATPFNRSDRA